MNMVLRLLALACIAHSALAQCSSLKESSCRTAGACWWNGVGCQLLPCPGMTKATCTSQAASIRCKWSRSRGACLDLPEAFGCETLNMKECSLAPGSACAWDGSSCYQKPCAEMTEVACKSIHAEKTCSWNAGKCLSEVTEPCHELSKTTCASQPANTVCGWSHSGDVCLDLRGAFGCEAFTNSRSCMFYSGLLAPDNACVWDGWSCHQKPCAEMTEAACRYATPETTCSWKAESDKCVSRLTEPCREMSKSTCTSRISASRVCGWSRSRDVCLDLKDASGCEAITKKESCELYSGSVVQDNACAWDGSSCYQKPCTEMTEAACKSRIAKKTCSWNGGKCGARKPKGTSCHELTRAACTSQYASIHCRWSHSGKVCLDVQESTGCEMHDKEKSCVESGGLKEPSNACHWDGWSCYLKPCDWMPKVACESRLAEKSCTWEGGRCVMAVVKDDAGRTISGMTAIFVAVISFVAL